MAWNDPGKKSNPWQRGPEQGPPDLDEVLRRLQQRLRGLFGGAGGGSGEGGATGGGPALPANLSLILVLVVVVGLWSMTGFYTVDEAERGVITRFGRYVGTTQPGWRWHLPWPIERRTIVNVSEFKSYSDTARMLTSDEALVDIELAVAGLIPETNGQIGGVPLQFVDVTPRQAQMVTCGSQGACRRPRYGGRCPQNQDPPFHAAPPISRRRARLEVIRCCGSSLFLTFSHSA